MRPVQRASGNQVSDFEERGAVLPCTSMRSAASLVLVAGVMTAGCVLGPVEFENKRCDADHPCTTGFMCAADGVCRAGSAGGGSAGGASGGGLDGGSSGGLAGGSSGGIAGGASGQATVSEPGADGAGQLKAGFIEGSNVQIVDEMVRMILAQRAYEINSKAVQSADDMLGILNNLKR